MRVITVTVTVCRYTCIPIHLQARLELEVQRLSGELSSSERKLELLASDLAAERDRVVAQAALLERKVGHTVYCNSSEH